MKSIKIHPLVRLAAGVMSLPGLILVAGGKSGGATIDPPAMAVATPTLASDARAPEAASTAPNAALVVPRWAEIENDAFDQRSHFIAGYKRLEARVEDQVRELKAKRATMTGTTDTADWDFAMKEEMNARDYLQSIGAELPDATSETWEQERAKAGRAWKRTQDAFDKVKISTTT